MPARDAYHDAVRNALVKDGWTITADPLRLRLRGGRRLFVDLGAERLLAAERGTEKIAVEVKGFGRPSEMADLEGAVGQYVLYARLLARQDAERTLYLAIPERARRSVFEEEAGQVLLEDGIVRLFSFDPELEVIVQWTP
ncbi:MAG: fatty-acid oxidation protein subunit alpha [Armatimonadota bacterium]|nr:fatty-acid oxidation protein subunit alpha [Armatimonadota bacterium]